MRKLLVMDAHNYSEDWEEIIRVAVRGIIFIDGRLLMIENNFGEAKLPGGGREGDEDDVQTLIREVAEETGHAVIIESIVPFGEIEEKRQSMNEEKIWHQFSRLYFCKVSEESGECHYTANEMKHGFRKVFYSVDEAIAKNEAMFGVEGKQAWNQREYQTFLLIKKYIEQQDKQFTRDFYQDCVYGKWRFGEKVSYKILKETKRMAPEDTSNPRVNMFKLSVDDEGTDVEINVEGGDGKQGTFTVRVYLPNEQQRGAWKGMHSDCAGELKAGYSDGESEQKDGHLYCVGEQNPGSLAGGIPYIVCMHPVQPKAEILARGCALIFMDTSMVAEDNCLHKGCFYDLYPYDDNHESQTGELMVWGWAASKVVDAMYDGLGRELGINPELAMITGVSRWGKATAVCGAFEDRFKVVIPVCSGAGGLALWDYQSEGKSYDLTECGGPAEYVYTQNEPLSCLQSEAERGWFNDRFLQYKSYEEIPINQYMLPVMAADKNRFYFVVAAWMGEDWVNTPAMKECFDKAQELYRKMGLENNIYAHFHKEGHALLAEDVEYIFDTLKGRL